jgi:hypothetical protein
MDDITKTLVADNKRLDFLPSFTGRHCMTYEHMIFDKLREATKGVYNGGYWEYYTLSNGGFYMGLGEENTCFEMECLGNYFNGTMSADAASIAVNLCVQNAFAWQIDSKKHSAHFYQLREYAVQHLESRQILGFID